MEDLIININESMKTRAQYIIHEEKLSSILEGQKDPDAVERIAMEINPDFKKNIISASLISKEVSTNLQVHTYFDNLMYHRARLENANHWTFVKSGFNVVLICSFSDEELKDLNGISYIKAILAQNGFVTSAFYIGYETTPLRLCDLKQSVTNAQVAGAICQLHNQDCLSYEEVGIYNADSSIVINKDGISVSDPNDLSTNKPSVTITSTFPSNISFPSIFLSILPIDCKVVLSFFCGVARCKTSNSGISNPSFAKE